MMTHSISASLSFGYSIAVGANFFRLKYLRSFPTYYSHFWLSHLIKCTCVLSVKVVWKGKMYSQTNTSSTNSVAPHAAPSTSAAASSTTSQSETRLAVADILSTMASGEPITPSTYATLDGFSTGVLTQTTPTLTPTTLRSIEQTFIELQTVAPPHQIPHQNEAGFVPPVVNSHLIRGNSSTAGSLTRSSQPPNSTSNGTLSYQKMISKELTNHGNSSSSSTGSNSSNSSSGWTNGRGTTTSTRGGSKGGGRHMGGRRPAKYEKLTPEEEERRRVRRERNKLAAARCRKRRMDHTNSLVYETEGLEEHRSSLQSEIQELQNQKDELEFILEAHKVVCKLHKHNHNHEEGDGGGNGGHEHHHDHEVDIKPDLMELQMAMASSNATPTSTSIAGRFNMGTTVVTTASSKIQRPNSLALSSTFAVPHPPSVVNPQSLSSSKLSLTEATGIAISTPSSGIFNFEALMEGGTGLTPVSSGTGFTLVVPTCSTQQRSSGSDLSSPDTMNPPKLVSL